MMPHRHRQRASSSRATPEPMTPGATEDEKMDKAKRQQTQARKRKRWWIGSAIILMLILLCLGLSLGLTLGRKHHGHSDSNGPTAHREALLPPIDLGYSKYEGSDPKQGVHQWLGMRYAAPPFGDLRFAAPQDPIHNDTVQKATRVCL